MYTEGEWKYIPESTDYCDGKERYDGCYRGVIHGGHLNMALCVMISDCLEGEVEANALLISKAPKMFEAIQSAIVEIEDGSPHHAHLILTETIKELI